MRRALISLACLLLALSAVAAGPASAFTLIVTEPGTPLVPNSVLELAARLGYFQREGVDVALKRVAGTPSAIAALATGGGDMANISLESLLKLSARGETRFRAVFSPSKSFSYVIAARNGIATVPELEGKAFGVGQVGTLDYTLSGYVLRHGGLDPADVDIVSIGAPQARLNALVAGKIDATTVSFGTWSALPDKSGLHVLVSKDDYFRAAPVVAKVNVVPQQALQTQRAAVIKVAKAILKLARDFSKDPQRWAQVMAKERPQVSAATLRTLARSYASDWCVDGCFEAGELQRSVKLLYRSPDFRKLPLVPMAQWADFSVVRNVLQQIGRAGE